ncbi:MAG: PAS domain S-box protein [Armatimonadetes bacterium]|nr:PAS domain S-box protein [Armatimonadota bacterium]
MDPTHRIEELERENTRLKAEVSRLSGRGAAGVGAATAPDVDPAPGGDPGKRAEEALRESEERFRSVLEGSRDVVYRLDLRTGRFEYISPSCAAVVGYTAAELMALDSEAALAMIHPDDLPVMREALTRLKETGTAEAEYRQRGKDGTYHWISNRMALTRDAAGRPLYRDGSIRDITARRQAEEALRASEERYRTLFTNMISGMLVGELLYDDRGNPYDWRYTDANPAHLRAINRSPEEVVGRRITELYGLDRAPEPFLTHYAQVARTGEPVQFEAYFDTLRMHMHVSAFPLGGNRLAAIAMDITARRQAEQRTRALHEITAALSAALTPEQVGGAVLKETARVIGAATGGLLLLDEDARELVLCSSLGLDEKYLPSAGRVPLDARMAAAEAVRTGRTVAARSPAEFEAVSPDSAPGFRGAGLRSAVALPLKAWDRVLGAITLGFPDAREFAAEEMAFLSAIAAQTALALERARLYAEAARQADELRGADRRKDEFLAMLAHELRNPLAAISSAAQLLRTEDLQGRPGRATEIVGRQAAHMARLLDDLLDVSRVTHGKIELKRERMSLTAAIESALEAARPTIEEAGHRLRFSGPGYRLDVEGDPVRIAQVVGNLLNNAAKYTPPAGHIYLTVEPADREVAIRVRDTGIGISPEVLPRVFDLFVQADTSVARSQGGLGIGLTMVRSLVELHGGRVEAQSEGPGQGSEFTVWLPLAAVPVAAPRKLETGAVQRRRILVVDDNADGAEILGLTLEIEGHEIATATSGPEALQVATDFHPEVVLLDLGMPVMDGCEVARRFRSDPKLKGVVLVALTGYGQEEDRQRTAEAGFDYHLVKPVEMEEITRVLCNIYSGGG